MPEVYLTFDDGPYPATDVVLDVLRETKATATFFLQIRRQGDRAAQFKTIRRMLAEGHSIGSHGVDHDPATRKGYETSTPAEVKKDFEENRQILEKMFTERGATFPGFQVARLPGDGRFFRNYVDMIVNDIKVPHAGWDMEFSDSGRLPHINHWDWQGIRGVAATRRGFPNDRDVLLLHDLHWGKHPELLASLIKKLQTAFTVLSMVPVPTGLGSIRYKGR